MQQEEFQFQEEDDERKRFQIELEFVQSLANPNYLNYLAQRGYFKNQSFLNYLKYLMYWKEPEYCKYLIYPQCFSLLEMLQHEQFIKEIVNAQCSKYIDEQLLLLWLHYKKRHDWVRVDPTIMPKSVEKLIENDQDHQMIMLKLQNNEHDVDTATANEEDAFSVKRFIINEKF
jgi:mediator of RNA polymerase II transcription subunit 31